jgi:hypothetical protein
VAPLAPADVPGVVYLTEPDVAVIRAGLVGLCARSAGLAPLGERIAYLGGPRPGPAGLSRSWPVLATVRWTASRSGAAWESSTSDP